MYSYGYSVHITRYPMPLASGIADVVHSQHNVVATTRKGRGYQNATV